MSTLCENLLHKAVCQAVALLNTAPDVVRITEGRKARDILRQALAEHDDVAQALIALDNNGLAGGAVPHRFFVLRIVVYPHNKVISVQIVLRLPPICPAPKR